MYCPYMQFKNNDQVLKIKKKNQKSKMAVWGGLTNSCEKKRS